eukprot:TRINITY_DN2679_c0_g2_i1.p1 TRINITY_DN2679_c0_g2~~TRINITY_DN2679_c0_g2_i1.p1  ORF type:complete len:158 (+),score=33.15 TRINITY_DN2679_c0_g2_i1:68-475(+)
MVSWELFFWNSTIFNLSILIFNRFFTSNCLQNIRPNVFNHMGVFLILVWGVLFTAAYYATLESQSKWASGIFFLFAVEKMTFALDWAYWRLNYDVKTGRLLKDTDIITKIFYLIYGVGDFSFGVAFAFYGLSLLK